MAGPGVDLSLASRSIAPTVAVISAETAAKLHSTTNTSVTSGPKKLAHYLETRMLTAGRLPTDNLLTKLNAPTRATIGTTPGKLRLVFVSERAGLNTPPLSSEDLSDLRIYTKARVVYALTAAKVAGAVAQTNIYDYRGGVTPSNKHSHFGAPISCVEIKLKDTPQHKTTDEQSIGELVVTGSSVAGGEVSLGINGTSQITALQKENANKVQRWFARTIHLHMFRYDHTRLVIYDIYSPYCIQHDPTL